MPKIPRISARQAIKAFEKIGYLQTRQRDSHIRLRHPDYPERKPFTIPNHRILKIGLLQKCIKDAELTAKEFTKLL
jgi:predicted RNA binding protein YcfA (HicA-like mRNA interferase family)